MFFIVSKIAWFILAPLNLFCICLFIGVILWRIHKSTAKAFLGIAGFMLIVFGVLPTGAFLLHQTERIYSRPATMPEHIDGILVLGGNFPTDLAGEVHKYHIPVTEAAERLVSGLQLQRDYPSAKLVYTGGNGQLLGKKNITEADMAKAFIDGLGHQNDKIIYESQSRNTYENLLYTQELVKPEQTETWILVTSGYHMPRAMGIAQKLGWPEVIAYPVDIRISSHLARHYFVPRILDNMQASNLIIREYLGIVAYRATGKMVFPF